MLDSRIWEADPSDETQRGAASRYRGIVGNCCHGRRGGGAGEGGGGGVDKDGTKYEESHRK